MYLPKSKTGSIFIIGNSEEKYDISYLIRKDDVVIRFNSPNKTSPLKADVLFVANSSDMVIGRDIINDSSLIDNAIVIWRYYISDMFFSRYQSISFSRKLKYILFFDQFKKLNKFDLYRQLYYPRDLQQCCSNIIGSLPSTGFLAIYLYLNLYPERKIYLHNFTFSGWKGHNWESEKKYIDALVKSKKIILLK